MKGTGKEICCCNPVRNYLYNAKKRNFCIGFRKRTKGSSFRGFADGSVTELNIKYRPSNGNFRSKQDEGHENSMMQADIQAHDRGSVDVQPRLMGPRKSRPHQRMGEIPGRMRLKGTS